MTRLASCRGSAWWGRGLVILAALIGTACGDVNISPTAPSWGFPGNGSGLGIRQLQITGSLTAEDGTCLEARVLYDSQELPGSRVVCADAAGCTRLDLEVSTTSGAGRHTLSLQVLRQSSAETSYVADVTIRLTRGGLPWLLPIHPSPRRATLKAGDSVTFELNFTDWD